MGACDGSRYYQLAKHVPFVFANLRDSYIWSGIIVITSFVFVTSCCGLTGLRLDMATTVSMALLYLEWLRGSFVSVLWSITCAVSAAR